MNDVLTEEEKNAAGVIIGEEKAEATKKDFIAMVYPDKLPSEQAKLRLQWHKDLFNNYIKRHKFSGAKEK